MAERGCPPNYHAFGTFGTSPAEQAWVPKASRDTSPRTFGKKKIALLEDWDTILT